MKFNAVPGRGLGQYLELVGRGWNSSSSEVMGNIINSLLCARQCAKHFPYINSLKSDHNPLKLVLLLSISQGRKLRLKEMFCLRPQS